MWPCDVLENERAVTNFKLCRSLFVRRRIHRFLKAESSAYTNLNTKQPYTAAVELETTWQTTRKQNKAKPSKIEQSLKFRDRTNRPEITRPPKTKKIK